MKILHLFDFFSPYGGGTVDLIFKLAREMAKRGHEVAIYASDYKLDKDYIASLPEVSVKLFHCIFSLAQFYITPGFVKGIREDLRSFDIAHMHCFRSFQNIVVHHYALKYGVPYVVDSHGSLPRSSTGEKGFKWLLRYLFDVIFGFRILRDAEKVIAETNMGIEEYRRFGVASEKIVLIPPPFDTAAFSDLPPGGLFREKYKLAEKKVIMFLGRIHWIKGLDFLVRGFHELTGIRDDVIMVIVGNDDGYKTHLDRMISDFGLRDRVLFTGFLGGQDKLSALVDADVVIQTSRYEQGAWAPFEAVLCGTPIIVSSNSGAGEDVKKIDAGYLVEYGNNLELRNMIQYVLNNPEEARAKTKIAKAYIETNLSISSGINKYIKTYEEITGRSRP